MVDLSGSCDEVTSLFECFAQAFTFRNKFLPVVAVLITTGRTRSKACHQSCAGRIAERRNAIGTHERDAHFRKAIDVRSLRLRVSTSVADPVIEIIYGNKEDVWLRFGLRFVFCDGVHWQGRYQKKDQEFVDHAVRD